MIEFLTQDGCVATDRMRAHLDTAMKELGRSAKYTVTDVDTLDASDQKRGYGTPTVLVGGRDQFGMAEPAPETHTDLTALFGRSSVHRCNRGPTPLLEISVDQSRP